MFAGDPNVSPFRIKNDNQPSLAGMQGQLVPHRDAIWAKSLVTGRLDFDGRNQMGQLVHDPQAKVPDNLKIVSCREAIANRINPDTQWGTGAAHRTFKRGWF